MSFPQPPPYPEQPPYPQGQGPPGQYSQPGRYPQPGYPPGQYGPGPNDPNQYPPGQAPPDAQHVQRRRGCRGCLVGCLIACVVGATLLVVTVAAGVILVRQMFPTSESVEAAATCVITRVLVSNAESGIDQSDATSAEKEQMRRELERLRQEYERNCAPVP